MTSETVAVALLAVFVLALLGIPVWWLSRATHRVEEVLDDA